MGEPYRCRLCSHRLSARVLDLGRLPLANSLLENPNDRFVRYPLELFRCDRCLLVQVGQAVNPEVLFSVYNYQSSFSSTWRTHAQSFARQAIKRLGLEACDRVVEVGSNDGILLQQFLHAGFPVLGIEPAKNVAEKARADGLPTVVDFFGSRLARELIVQNCKARLLIANNVVPHVPDLHDFLKGTKILLDPNGIFTMEFHYLKSLIEHTQFDAIYHEHVSYFTLHTIRRALNRHELDIFDCEHLPIHGGSLRVWGTHAENTTIRPTNSVMEILESEKKSQIEDEKFYLNFAQRTQARIAAARDAIASWVGTGQKVVGYGAPAKATTFLNCCGINSSQMVFVVDRSPLKQGKWIPGTNIPILTPEAIATAHPDIVVNLCWNLNDEIATSLAYIKEWGGEYRLL